MKFIKKIYLFIISLTAYLLLILSVIPVVYLVIIPVAIGSIVIELIRLKIEHKKINFREMLLPEKKRESPLFYLVLGFFIAFFLFLTLKSISNFLYIQPLKKQLHLEIPV